MEIKKDDEKDVALTWVKVLLDGISENHFEISDKFLDDLLALVIESKKMNKK